MTLTKPMSARSAPAVGRSPVRTWLVIGAVYGVVGSCALAPSIGMGSAGPSAVLLLVSAACFIGLLIQRGGDVRQPGSATAMRFDLVLQRPHYNGCVDQLERASAEAQRFRQHGPAFGTPAWDLATTTASSLEAVLWQAGQMAIKVLVIENEVASAGESDSGPAKRAWRTERTSEASALSEQVRDSLQPFGALANLAEEVTYSAKLATGWPETELGPTQTEVLASMDIDEASSVLRSKISAWEELDSSLRRQRRRIEDELTTDE